MSNNADGMAPWKKFIHLIDTPHVVPGNISERQHMVNEISHGYGRLKPSRTLAVVRQIRLFHLRKRSKYKYVYLNFHTIYSPKKHANYKAKVEMDIHEAN